MSLHDHRDTSFKGGVRKTTTAVRLAAYFQTFAPTLLVDGDIVRASTKWASRGSLPFKVAPRNLGSEHPSSAARSELKGKNLSRYCGLDHGCHADVLLNLVNGGSNA
jgi:hypothetical protein